MDDDQKTQQTLPPEPSPPPPARIDCEVCGDEGITDWVAIGGTVICSPCLEHLK